MINLSHEYFMMRCFELAKHGKGTVAPNPLVGCVIVYNGEIIGEGYHKMYGEAHAEVNAINAVLDKSLLLKSTLYVSLEPCNHFGKTPPCSDLIIEKKIPNVVIAMKDPFYKVDGEGIKKLENAGIKVSVGILEKEAKELNCRFITFHQQKRPYIILKWAQSKDGFIGSKEAEIQISNELSKVYTHKWRSEERSVLVGSNTARIDNPKLNVRHWEGKNPIRILLDNSGTLNNNLNLFDGSQKTYVAGTNKKISYPNTEKIILEENDFMNSLLHQLYEKGIQSVLVEGGAKTLQQFIDSEYWDEAYIFIADKKLEQGISAPIFNHLPIETIAVADNQLLHFKNSKNR